MDVIRKLKNKPKILLIGEFWKKIMLEISPLLNKDENDIYIIIEDFNEIKKYL
jgi:hypothetical protein